MRDQHQVGERQRVSGDEGLVAEQARDLVDHLTRQRERGADRVLIDRQSEGGRDHAPERDGGAEPGRDIGIDDAYHLVHARAPLRIGRRQRRFGRYLIDIIDNRACLVEAEIAVIERRNLLERVDRLVSRIAMGAHRERRQPPGQTLFLEHQQRCADIRAARNAMDNEIGHCSCSLVKSANS